MVLHDHQTTTVRILLDLIGLFSFAELLVVDFGGVSTFKVMFSFIIVKFIMRDLTHYL